MDSDNAKTRHARRVSKSNYQDKEASSQTARTSDITDAQGTTDSTNDRVTALDIACSFFNRREAGDRSKVDLIYLAKRALKEVQPHKKNVKNEPERNQDETVPLHEARRRAIVQGRLKAHQGTLETRKTELLGALKPLCDEWKAYVTENQRQLTLPGLETIDKPLEEFYQALERVLSRESETQYDQASQIWNNAYIAADKLKTFLLPEKERTRFRKRNEEETGTNVPIKRDRESTKVSASASSGREYKKACSDLNNLYHEMKRLEAKAMKGK